MLLGTQTRRKVPKGLYIVGIMKLKNILSHRQVSSFATTFMLSLNLRNNDSLRNLVPVLRVKMREFKVLFVTK